MAKRSPNFSDHERYILVDAVQHYPLLLKTDKSVGARRKREAEWEKVTELFCADGDTVKRTASELKTAFVSLVTRAKKKVADHKAHGRATGGGPAPRPLSPTTQTICRLLPQTFQALPVPDDEGMSVVSIFFREGPSAAGNIFERRRQLYRMGACAFLCERSRPFKYTAT